MKIRLLIVAAAFALPLVCGAQSDEELDADASMTYDGLVQVKRTGYRNVWVKPDADISIYSKIMPGGAQFHYRDVPEGTQTRRSSDDQYFIQENTRNTLEETMREIFREEIMDSDYFTLVDVPGRDTVLVWGGLHGLFLAVERWLNAHIGHWKMWNHLAAKIFLGLLTYFLVNITWVFFRAQDFATANRMIRTMLTFDTDGKKVLTTVLILQTVVTIAVMLLIHWRMRNRRLEEVISRQPLWLLGLIWGVLLTLIIITQGGSNAFIYFQF